MHGGPASMARDAWAIRWNYALLAAPGYVLVATSSWGSTGFGEAFGQAIQRDPLKTPGDEINQAADVAIGRYRFIFAVLGWAAGPPPASPNTAGTRHTALSRSDPGRPAHDAGRRDQQGGGGGDCKLSVHRGAAAGRRDPSINRY